MRTTFISIWLLVTAVEIPAAEDPWHAWDEVYASPGLDLYVPPARAAELRPLVAQLQADWARWERSLPTPITGRAVLWFNDDDDLAGQLEDESFGLYTEIGVTADPWGPGGTDQTLLRARRQLARLSLTQRIPGWRGQVARTLGEQSPADPLGLVATLLVLPAPDSFPAWWTEALLAWQGREEGDVRPSTWRTLARTVWRLEAEATPDPAQWRTAVAEWPYSLRASAYGLAYGEALAARFPGRLPEVATAHQARPPFWFTGAPIALLGVDHQALLAQVARELSDAQQRDLAAIVAAGVCAPQRLTADDVQVREAVWLTDGTLLVREDEVLVNRQRLTLRDAQGRRLDGWFTSLPLASDAMELRRSPDATGKPTATTAELDLHGRLRARAIGEQLAEIPDLRLRQTTMLADGSVLAIQLPSSGGQLLIHGRPAVPAAAVDSFTLLSTAPVTADAIPWSPASSPDGKQVAWIERTATGSRLMEADLPGFANPRQRWAVAGAMLLPQYTPDGQAIVLSSDHTGVANAWRIPRMGAPVAITNTRGGVLACLPSPDGTQYAIIDHDREGAFLGFLPSGTTANPPQLPEINAELGKQSEATGDRNAAAQSPRSRLPAPRSPLPAPRSLPATGSQPIAEPTSGDGFRDFGFQGLTPTTSPSRIGPAGQLGTNNGIGLQVFAGDPMWRSRLIIGAGVGDHGVPVGAIRYGSLHLAPLELAVEAHRHSNTYEELLNTKSGREDYRETVTGGRVSASIFLDPEGENLVGIHAGTEHYASLKDDQLPANALGQLPYTGNERYVELTSRLDTRSENDLSPGPETGFGINLEARHSGLGGDLARNRLIVGLEGTLSIWPAAGHQLVARTVGGWSDGDDPLQGSFAVGGNTINSATILRGYNDLQAVGEHLAGLSVGYRIPLWRPRFGNGSQAWYFRQVVLEPFADAAKTSSNRPLGDGEWYRAVGAQVNLDIDVWVLRLRPGLIGARQLDGPKDFTLSFTLGGGTEF